MSDVLISGGHGWLGALLAEGLEQKYYRVSQFSLRETLQKNTSFLNSVPVAILAGTNYGRGQSSDDLIDLHLSYVESFTLNALRLNVKLIIYIDTLLPKGYSPYADAKWFAREKLEKDIDGGIKLISIKLNTFFGSLIQRYSFTQDVLRACYLNSKYFEIRCPDNIRDFIYIKDAIASILFVLDLYKKKDYVMRGPTLALEVGSGRPTSFKEFAYLAKEVFGATTQFIEPDEPFIKEVLTTNTEAIRALGWRPQFTLRQALEDTRMHLNSSPKNWRLNL